MDPLSPLPGRRLLRVHRGPVPTDIVDVVELANVDVTSEQELHPVDYLFDGRDGPHGSRWIAATHGPQSIVLRFHRPLELLGTVVIESEQRGDTRLQQIEVAGWSSGEARPFEAPAQILEYSPDATSFHRSVWELDHRRVTHLCVRVLAAPGSRLASLTSLVLKTGRIS